MLKKNLVELCLLHLLSKEDQYGYDLLRHLHEAFPDTQESAIYALLRGLERNKYAEQYLGTASNGPARKYYRITDHGLSKYSELLKQWLSLLTALSKLGISNDANNIQ